MDNRIFSGGKYKGCLVDEVVNLDPQYIIFCYENGYWKHTVTKDDYEAAQVYDEDNDDWEYDALAETFWGND